MDRWDFLKWRKTLRYTQAEAGEKLGVNRATIQNWESGFTRVSKTAELACQELTREWKRRPEFGPVTLAYADDPTWRPPDDPHHTAVQQSELCHNNEAALQLALRLSETLNFNNPFIIESDGDIVWTTPELLRECDKRREEARAKMEKYEAGPPKVPDSGTPNPKL